MSKTQGVDNDYAWLKTHLNYSAKLESRERLVEKIVAGLKQRIQTGRLPFTLGVFGGWGAGKTTCLAMIAEKLEDCPGCKVVYFNSWKYAGFMEIVPSLIYKILQYGIADDSNRDEAARRILLALGNKYTDQLGKWAQNKVGIDPVALFKDIYSVPDIVEKNNARVMPEVVRAYYTQVDKAQDELRNALGTVVPGSPPTNTVVVLIDELDRCDPDEAFNVIKQMRVLFGMRDLPVAFIVCANPEPIGLAIKHRYGLESDTGDYEARRILEKFVDSYEDLSESEPLSPLVKYMWKDQAIPWIVQFDAASLTPELEVDEVGNATAFDAITTSIPLFSNIRVLQKSFEYIADKTHSNRHLLWTKWFLQIANQIDPKFRRDIRVLAEPIQNIVFSTYASLQSVRYKANRSAKGIRFEFETDKGRTLFAIFRSFIWEHANSELKRISKSDDPEELERARALASLLAQPLRVDIVVLLSLLPLEPPIRPEDLRADQNGGAFPGFIGQIENIIGSFGYELAS
jgi:hypothetical protein